MTSNTQATANSRQGKERRGLASKDSFSESAKGKTCIFRGDRLIQVKAALASDDNGDAIRLAIADRGEDIVKLGRAYALSPLVAEKRKVGGGGVG